ncbi:hypothetical protein ACWELQ_05435, partial [Nocardia sp. NPDC004722]
PAPPQAVAGRALRERILEAVRAGQPVPRQLWDDLRDADDLLAASMLSRRVDAGRGVLGGLRVADDAEILRAMVVERRCTELALLLAEEPTRQTLRDSLYACEQILNHPLFPQAPVTAAAVQPPTTAPRRTATFPGPARPAVAAPADQLPHPGSP